VVGITRAADRDTPFGVGDRSAATARSVASRFAARLAERRGASERLFPAEAQRVTVLAQRMAERFARGGRLFALGCSADAGSDVHHITVEFVHPAIVGKRALPACALIGTDDAVSTQLALLARADDIAVAVDADAATALAAANARGCLTIAFSAAAAEWVFDPAVADPFIRQELVEVLYHILYELVHVFLEHRGQLDDCAPAEARDRSSFLYPFLDAAAGDLQTVAADARASVLMKAAETAAVREQTLRDGADTLLAVADALRDTFSAGGALLVFGNGGSATDAMDVVADLRSPPRIRHGASWPSRPAIDLTADPAVLTAIGNDIGAEAIFARQVIAYGRPGDCALALSTSGSSPNVIAALQECRRRHLTTIAFVGYDGGRIAAESLADHLVISRSQHVPRIQEAQATAAHVLRELIEDPPSTASATPGRG
jgi:D-sedoheptulose 7-phosphate isomerase